ncbi:MAG: hypothetical protein KA784_00305 [Aquabacterium sp.]|nr:hypothetical protein [Aquabacterium sp.]
MNTKTLTADAMKRGAPYNWTGQPDRLIYLRKHGNWHQFKKIGNPREVWCEVLDEDLHMLEETACGCQQGTCESKPTGCRMTAEILALDDGDDQAWDRNAERLTRGALGADVDRPINMQATSVDDL